MDIIYSHEHSVWKTIVCGVDHMQLNIQDEDHCKGINLPQVPIIAVSVSSFLFYMKAKQTGMMKLTVFVKDALHFFTSYSHGEKKG